MLGQIGWSLEELDQHIEALEVHRESLEFYRELGDEDNQAFCLSRIGRNLEKLGDFQRGD